MTRPLFGFRATLALGLVVVVAAAGGWLWWERTAREREIERLKRAVDYLTASYPIARLVVVEQTTPPIGETTTTVRLWFVDDEGRRKGGPGEIELVGSRVYFEALMVVFGAPLVESGERRSLAFPTRLFTESIAPREGFALAPLDGRGVPTVYALDDAIGAGDLTRDERREVLGRFWELANDPDAAAAYGIDVLQGEAVFTEYEIGRFYSIFVEADGGLTVRPELHWID